MWKDPTFEELLISEKNVFPVKSVRVMSGLQMPIIAVELFLERQRSSDSSNDTVQRGRGKQGFGLGLTFPCGPATWRQDLNDEELRWTLFETFVTTDMVTWL